MINNKKTAICLYGFMRTYKETANSLLEHIQRINNADIFIYAPNVRGTSILPQNGDITALNAYKLQNKSEISDQDLRGGDISESLLQTIYLGKCKMIKLYDYDETVFKTKAASINSYNVMPTYRVLSMIYNISQTVSMLNQYCSENNTSYDWVVLCRPDLAFFSDLQIDSLNAGSIYVPRGMGRLDDGFNTQEQVYVEFYKNITRGQLIKHRSVAFTDQFIVGEYKYMSRLSELYKDIDYFIKIKFPLHPESLLYYKLFMMDNHPQIDYLENLDYEIVRDNTLLIDNSGMRYGIIHQNVEDKRINHTDFPSITRLTMEYKKRITVRKIARTILKPVRFVAIRLKETLIWIFDLYK